MPRAWLGDWVVFVCFLIRTEKGGGEDVEARWERDGENGMPRGCGKGHGDDGVTGCWGAGMWVRWFRTFSRSDRSATAIQTIGEGDR